MNSYISKKIKLSVLVVVLAIISSPVLAQDKCTLISSDITTFHFGIETAIPDVNHPITVDFFHTDIEVPFTQSGWDISVASDEPDSPFGEENIPPQDALLYVNSNARINLPSIPSGFEFIGARPGETFWVLPQSESSGILPLGLCAEEADISRLCNWDPNDSKGADTADKWFEVKIVDVRGPADANFSMWQADAIHPPVVFVSTAEGGLTDDDVFYISAGSHTHLNWGFTKPGPYEVDLQVSTVYKCDATLIADIAPIGNEFYRGNCIVDFDDFALIALHWLETGCGGQGEALYRIKPAFGGTDSCEGADLDGNGEVGVGDLAILAEQLFHCGYPGCEN
jgi:surface-anchored protein